MTERRDLMSVEDRALTNINFNASRRCSSYCDKSRGFSADNAEIRKGVVSKVETLRSRGTSVIPAPPLAMTSVAIR
jgi:hypothetical protein